MNKLVIIGASGHGKVVADIAEKNGYTDIVFLDEMIHGIVDVFSPEDKKSQITYDPEKPDTLQSILDWSKTATELGYAPEYNFIDMMRDFKKEMEIEPFSKLWGTGKYYDDLYKDKV